MQKHFKYLHQVPDRLLAVDNLRTLKWELRLEKGMTYDSMNPEKNVSASIQAHLKVRNRCMYIEWILKK